MPFTDIAVALQISFTYFTILYLTGLGDCSASAPAS